MLSRGNVNLEWKNRNGMLKQAFNLLLNSNKWSYISICKKGLKRSLNTKQCSSLRWRPRTFQIQWQCLFKKKHEKTKTSLVHSRKIALQAGSYVPKNVRTVWRSTRSKLSYWMTPNKSDLLGVAISYNEKTLCISSLPTYIF